MAALSGSPVLVLNAGSATLKAGLVAGGTALAGVTLDWQPGDGGPDRAGTLRAALEAVLGAREAGGRPPLDAVAHRVVHGGPDLTAPTRLDDAVLAAIDAVGSLAPLHNVAAVATIRSARELLPDVPHVACFDTAFHATLPEWVRRYPVPEAWHELGIRRYGFHGLSVEWSARRAAELLAQPAEELRLVVAHLGGGCSVTAVDGGRSVWTSMGFTPLEGLMMGTRSGSLDPGILLHLLRTGARDAAGLARDLEHGSGLLGVSGRSGDVRELEAAAADGDARAILALGMFVERAAAAIAAASTSLDRLDALVLTGGIGEHAATLRAAIVGRLGILGLPGLDADDTGEDAVLAWDGVGPAVLRVEAREDLVMAAAAERVLAD